MSAMELSTLVFGENTMFFSSFAEVLVLQTLIATVKSLAYLFLATGSLLSDANNLLSPMVGRFPLDQLYKGNHTCEENKDGSETEDDDEDDDDDDVNDEDDGDDDDEDFSGDEGDEEADPEDDPVANGAGGSDDDDDDDDDGDDDNDDENGEDEDEDEDDEDEDEDEEVAALQPPAKKRK